MTVQNPAIFLQAGSHPAEDVRRMIASVFGDRKGVVGEFGFLQAHRVGLAGGEKVQQLGQADLEGVDVPAGDLHGIGSAGATGKATAARIRRAITIRAWTGSTCAATP